MDAVQNMVRKLLANREKAAQAPESKQPGTDFKDALKQELDKATNPQAPQSTTGQDATQSQDSEVPTGMPQDEALTQEQQSLLAALLMAPVVVPLEEVQALPQLPTAPVALETAAQQLPVQTNQPQQTAPEAAQQLAGQPQQMQAVTPEQSAEAVEPETKPELTKPLVRTEQSSTEHKQDETVLSADAKTEAPLFRELEGKPVKVGETMQAETPAETVDTQVDKAVRQLLNQGDSRVTLQLNPGNLGKVMVELTQGKDGNLQILLSATTEKAVKLLEQSSGNLQSLLSNNGQNLVQIEVQRHQESQQSQYQPYDQEGGNRQNHQQEQRQHQEEQQSQDFLQQLRLGLVELDGFSGANTRSA